jgi:mycothiol synthase
VSITYRTFQKTDIPSIVHIANLIEAQQNDAGRTTAEGLQQLVAAPHIKAEEDFFVALNADAEIVGMSMMMLRPENGMIVADVTVHPSYQEAVAELVKRSEAQAVQRANSDAPDAPVIHINFGVSENKRDVRAALENSDYHEVRRQYVMRIALDTPFNQPEFPAGYEFRPFEQARDAQHVHAVFQECFADHWGEVAQIPFEQWAHQFENPLFDPTLWHILYHNDDIAALCLCEITRREASLGLVEVLGVRPAFRKHGLGGLLLKHAFRDFQRRGYSNVALDVDTQNTTNAVALYEKAGMSVYHCKIFYRKMLRGSSEAIED